MGKYLNKNGIQYLWQKALGRFLTPASLKTINNQSLVGSGNIDISAEEIVMATKAEETEALADLLDDLDNLD